MVEMFSQEWAKGFSERWNNTAEMTEPLGQAKFCSTIGFGYQEEEHPRIKLTVVDGRVSDSGPYTPSEEKLDWDLRATPEQWAIWRKEPLTIIGLGVAVARGMIHFKAGDYRGMIRQMQLAKPFLHFFTIL
jgi:hypothetical protein